MELDGSREIWYFIKFSLQTKSPTQWHWKIKQTLCFVLFFLFFSEGGKRFFFFFYLNFYLSINLIKTEKENFPNAYKTTQ